MKFIISLLLLIVSYLAQAARADSVSLSNPPLLNQPFNRENIPAGIFQNIIFSWTPLHMGSVNAAFSTEYQFDLWEIYNNDVPVESYVLTAPIFYTTTTSSPILIYGPTAPMLIEGKRYAWRVRVKAKEGFSDLELFTNQGYSQVLSFTYAANCPEPSQILLSSPFDDQIKVQWQDNMLAQKVKIKYRDKSKNKWYEETTTDKEFYITKLKPNTEYEVKIANVCLGDIETYSQPATLKTKEKGKTEIPNFACGTPPKKLDLSNKNPLQSLTAGDKVQAGDFEIEIIEANGGGGTFSGKGFMRVPYFKLAKLNVVFNNIKVNTDKRLIDGYFQAVVDWENGNYINTKDVAKLLIETLNLISTAFSELYKKIVNAKKPEDVKAAITENNEKIKSKLEINLLQGYPDPAEQEKVKKRLDELDAKSMIASTNSMGEVIETAKKNQQEKEKLVKEIAEKSDKEQKSTLIRLYSLYKLVDEFKANYLVKCKNGEFTIGGESFRAVVIEWDDKINKPLKFKKIEYQNIKSIKVDEFIRNEINSNFNAQHNTSGDFLDNLGKYTEFQAIKTSEKTYWCAYNELTKLGIKTCNYSDNQIDEDLSKEIISSIDNCFKRNENISNLKFLSDDKIKVIYRGYNCETRPPPCEGDINNVGQIYSKENWVYGLKDKYVSFPLQPFDKTKLQTELGINPNDIRFEYHDNGPMNSEGTWYQVFYKYQGSDKEIGKISVYPLKYNSTPNDWINYYKAQSPEIFPKEAEDLKKNPFYFYILLQEDYTLAYSKGKHELLKTILEVACGNKWNTSASKETIGADLADKADNGTNLNLQIAQTRWQTFKANKVKVMEDIFEGGGKGVQGAGKEAKYPLNNFLDYVNSTFTAAQKQFFSKAENFYKSFNPSFNSNELRGIDFDFPVTNVVKQENNVMYQMATIDPLTGNPRFGSYFFENVNDDITKLGIGDINKIKVDRRVKVKVVLDGEVDILKSKTANIEDWNGSGNIFDGGGNQFYNPTAKTKIKSFEIVQTY